MIVLLREEQNILIVEYDGFSEYFVIAKNFLVIIFRMGYTVSMQYLLSLWIELAKERRPLSFIKVSFIL